MNNTHPLVHRTLQGDLHAFGETIALSQDMPLAVLIRGASVSPRMKRITLGPANAITGTGPPNLSAT